MGCPLRCTYCDTEYAFYEGKAKSFDAIFETLAAYGTKLVEVTGGEPLAQPKSIPFMRELVAKGYEVLLETSGAYPTASLPEEVQVILDVKTPSSGEAHRHHWDNMGNLKAGRDEVKFVVGDRADFDYALDVERRYALLSRGVTCLMSPVHGKLENKQLVEWILESRRDFRFQVQMHKYIWEPSTRGV